MRYFEDFAPGQTFELGSRSLTRDEIVAFATDWDPQPFHLDEEAARDSLFGGLVASGWHTVCVYMRLFVDGVLHGSASMGASGVEEVRWLAPVRPGDVLQARAEILDATPSERDPRRGTLRVLNELTNQDGVVVLRLVARIFIRRRGF